MICLLVSYLTTGSRNALQTPFAEGLEVYSFVKKFVKSLMEIKEPYNVCIFSVSIKFWMHVGMSVRVSQTH